VPFWIRPGSRTHLIEMAVHPRGAGSNLLLVGHLVSSEVVVREMGATECVDVAVAAQEWTAEPAMACVQYQTSIASEGLHEVREVVEKLHG